MKFPPAYLKNNEIAYKKIVQWEIKEGQLAVKYFQDIDILAFEKDLSTIEKVSYLITLHDLLMFCRNDYVIKQLRKIYLKDDCLQWFVSLNDITNQLEIIESKGIIIDKAHVLYSIRIHFIVNFSHQLSLWFDDMVYHDDVPMSTVSKMPTDFKNRQRYKIKTSWSPSPDLSTIEDHSIRKFIQFFTENAGALVKFSKGKTESTFLRYMIEECFDYDHEKVSLNKFLSTIYDLFRIIMPNYHFENEEEFLKKPLTNNNYDAFKANKLKKYVLGKKPAMKL